MFSDSIVESDAFLDMPLTAQALYMHLNMNTDSDGFVNPKRIMRMVGAAHDDLQILIAKRFLLTFDSGVVVIKHWWINNTKRMDRHAPTSYHKELEELSVKPNKSYTKNTTQLDLDSEVVLIPATKWQLSGNQLAPQSNSIQSNSIQFKAKQSKADKPQDFDKSNGLNKKTYAKAVRADEALAEKERSARIRKTTTGTKSIDQLFGGTS